MPRGAKVYLELEEISKTGFVIVLYYKGGLISDFRKLFTLLPSPKNMCQIAILSFFSLSGYYLVLRIVIWHIFWRLKNFLRFNSVWNRT